MITSLSNPRVKLAAKLRQRKQRAEQGRFLIDGVREIERAYGAGIEMDYVFRCWIMCDAGDARAVNARLVQDGVETLSVSEAVFKKLSYGGRTEGLLAVAKVPERSLDDISLPDDALVVVLENIEKPGNVGAVLRTADAVGAAAVLLCGTGADLWNPNTIRSSIGTVFTVPVCYADTDAILERLTNDGFRMLATRVFASSEYTDANYDGRTAIILGSEAEGLTKAWHRDDVTAVRLPMLGTADSLNVAATAAIVLYEALRQRSTL